MVRVFECNFCGGAIEPGTGISFVRKNGQLIRFCTRKCRRSLIDFKRDPRKFKWTKKYTPKMRPAE
ncbi:MAG: 50S ribosomal protein L24e [Candidatus Hodarchaeales archaeon]|jgi:large subunit ribosomal protein L24e